MLPLLLLAVGLHLTRFIELKIEYYIKVNDWLARYLVKATEHEGKEKSMQSTQGARDVQPGCCELEVNFM
jgi:hypothetical protein